MLYHQNKTKHAKMSLYLTSACNLECEECIMMNIMKHNSKYQMSIEEIEKLVKVSEISNYTFDFVLTGGEPLAYKNLFNALKILKASKITKSITMFSNAMLHNKISDEVVELIDSIRLSHYFYNDKHIEDFLKRYPKKVSVVERTEFYPNPKHPFSKFQPVECLNPEVLLYDFKVYACPHALSLVKKSPFESLEISTSLEINFLKHMSRIRQKQEETICSMCLSNNTIRKQLSKEKNYSKGKE